MPTAISGGCARSPGATACRWRSTAIPASSPQAKHRIERLFQTFQDRLRAELWLTDLDPGAVLCFRYLRIVAHDTTVTLGRHQVQILAGPPGTELCEARVEVHERLDGTVAVIYQGQRLVLGSLTPAPSTRIPARDHRRVRPKGPQSIQDLRLHKRKEGGRPPRPNRAQTTHGGICRSERRGQI